MADRAKIEETKRIDLVALIGSTVPLKRKGRDYEGLCPFHREKTASFKVSPAFNTFRCFGCDVQGDAVDWVRLTEGRSFREAIAVLTGADDNDQRYRRRPLRRSADGDNSSSAGELKRIRLARAIASGSQPGALETKIHIWLRSRAIVLFEPNPSLRFAPGFHYGGGVYLPAMVSVLLSSKHIITACQVTMLNPAGNAKANVSEARKTYGVTGDGAVRLAAATHQLGIAEGVETALAAMELSGIPVWACLGAGRMHDVKIPDTVTELHLFGDDDASGKKAVERTARKHRHRRVVIQLPPAPHNDWNDFLMAATLS